MAASVLYRAVRIPYLSGSGPRESLLDLTDVAHDLPIEEALCLEIGELCTATLVIEQTFYDIGRKLSRVTREQNKHVELYNTCCALETQWNEHHLSYKKLLWRSREFAGEAQASVDDFRELVLPSLRDQDRTPPEKQKIIRKQTMALESTSRPSQNLCQEFLDFGRTLDAYIIEFSLVVEDLEIGKQSKKVGQLEDRLRDARAAMEIVSREVKELGWKLATDVAVAGIALLLSLVIPMSWAAKVAETMPVHTEYGKILNCGLQFLDTRRRFDLAVAEYRATNAEYELERASLSQMVKLESTLRDSTPLVQEVAMKLGVFASVWAAITADIRELTSILYQAEDSTSQLFALRVQKLEEMYGYLSQALRHYQITVRLP